MNGNASVAVIGAGAAGLFASVTAAEQGACVDLYEKNPQPGKKLRITGKGRCNLINDCDIETFLSNVPRNPRFLYPALTAFPPDRVISYFTEIGVPLKTERGRRVFPVSDRAQDVVDALVRRAKELGVRFHMNTEVRRIESDGNGFLLTTARDTASYPAVIVTTGGCSYPLTGSTGDGYRFAEAFGLTVRPVRGSLVPLEADPAVCRPLMGLSLRNVALTVRDEKGREVYAEQGEMLFTHFGLSGPLVLSASAHLAPEKHAYTAEIDCKPALDEKTLDARLLSDFAKYANRDLCNALSELLPQKLILPMIEASGIDPRKKIHDITKEERHALRSSLKCFRVRISGLRPVREAIITSGGVAVKELTPGTMESRKIPGLYFAGEVIDCDAYTGGYNLGIAFSTAHLAGIAAAQRAEPGTDPASDTTIETAKEKKRMKNDTVRIAIDGPSGAGKSYLSNTLAKRLHFVHVDTGALYRAIGLYAYRHGVSLEEIAACIPMLPEISLRITYENGDQIVLLDGEDVSREIRLPEISMYASAVSALPEVRAFLLDTQRDIAHRENVIMDGRDIGTVILPDAQVKIFLTASSEARAKRRYEELLARGTETTYESVLSDMLMRDRNDSTRAIAPAVAAADAVLLDNSDLSQEETVERALEIIRDALGFLPEVAAE